MKDYALIWLFSKYDRILSEVGEIYKWLKQEHRKRGKIRP